MLSNYGWGPTLIRSVLLTSASMVAIGIITPAFSADVTISSGSTVGAQTVDGASTLTVEEGAVITDSADAVTDALNFTNITVNNSGTIVSTGNDGIDATDSNLTLSNSGRIEGNESGVFGFSVLNDLMNSGTIIGVDAGVSYAVITNLTNTGTISSTDSHGIDAFDIGTISNSGLILGGDGDAISISNDLTSLVNSGNIIGSVDGVYVFGTAGSITNSNNIIGYDFGINVGEVTNLINTGLISGITEDGISASCGCGINYLSNSGTIVGGSDGIQSDTITTLINSGTIVGLDDGVDTNILGNLTNLGTIAGVDKGIDADFGIILNSGTIKGAIGIEFDRSTVGNATVTNSGIISSSSGASGVAIDFQGTGSDILNLQQGSVLIGALQWDGTSDTLNFGQGTNAKVTFTNLPDNINFSSTLNEISGNSVTQVDPTFIKETDEVFNLTQSNIQSGIGDRLNGLTSGENAEPEGFGYNLKLPAAKKNSWISTWAGFSTPTGSGTLKIAAGGILLGQDWVDNVGDIFGIYAGYGLGVARIGSPGGHEILNNSLYFGGYRRFNHDLFITDFALQTGLINFDSKRYIANNTFSSGYETATSNYNGYYISPSIKVSKVFAHGVDKSIIPSLTLAHTTMLVDDYTEKWSGSDINVGSRVIQSITARGEIAYAVNHMQEDGEKYTTQTFAGVEGIFALDQSNQATASFAGSSQSVNLGAASDRARGFVGLRLNKKISSQSNFKSSMELGYDDQGSISASTSMKFNIKF